MAESTGQNNVTLDSKPKKIWNRDWWNRRTKLERTLLLITVTSLLLVFIMAVTLAAIGYLYQKNTNSLQELNSICLTPGCVRSAAEIMLNTDDSIDPCEDFYEFSCRGWINRQTIPENKTSVYAIDKMVDDMKLRLRVFIETLSDSEPEFIKMLKWMYDSCMDLKSIENFGADPLKNALKSLGGWPVLEGRKWKERYFNWIDTLKAIRKRGYSHNILIGLSVRPDHKNKVNVITLDRPNLEISDRSHFHNGLNDSTTSAYFEMMVKSAMLLGVGETTSRNEMLKAFQFETALANIILPHGERNDDEMNQKYTIKKLQQEFPQIPWLKYFDSLLNDKVYENETVIVYDPYYIRRFAELMASTEKRVVSNYMLWRVVHQSMYRLSKEWRNLELEYEFIVTGQREEEPRWKHCLKILENHLIVATSSYYLKRHLTEEMEDALLELVKYTKTEFLNILEEVDWMNKTAKQQIINKFRNMKVDIGYPKELRNTTSLTEYYKNLKITNDSYFENILSYRKWNSDFYISKLRKPYAEEKWMSKPEVSTIFTSYDGNTVGFSPAILDPSVLGKNSPQYINFGGMGSFIGFVFAAAFEIGSKEEHDGNKSSGEKTNDIFYKNVQCFYDQYSNYADDVMVEGVISMTGGLKNAYRAYRSWVKDHGNEQLLPGLKYTQNQMFWISAAYKFCEKKQPEGNKLSTALDDQNSASYRVNGPVSNLPEFAKDFSCPPDSPMNKKDRCKIW